LHGERLIGTINSFVFFVLFVVKETAYNGGYTHKNA
jgi:hypothetical protein